MTQRHPLENPYWLTFCIRVWFNLMYWRYWYISSRGTENMHWCQYKISHNVIITLFGYLPQYIANIVTWLSFNVRCWTFWFIMKTKNTRHKNIWPSWTSCLADHSFRAKIVNLPVWYCFPCTFIRFWIHWLRWSIIQLSV